MLPLLLFVLVMRSLATLFEHRWSEEAEEEEDPEAVHISHNGQDSRETQKEQASGEALHRLLEFYDLSHGLKERVDREVKTDHDPRQLLF